MSASPEFLTGDQWKDVTAVEAWKAGRRKHLEARWRKRKPPASVMPAPLLCGISLAAALDPTRAVELAAAAELTQWETESLMHRARRLETAPAAKKSIPKSRSRHQVPVMLGRTDAGEWAMVPALSRAAPGKLEKAKLMFEAGLERKAQRELACGILGGEVICKTGHSFRVSYECGNRYCVRCGMRGANRLFARQHDRLFFTATRMMLCGVEECSECGEAIEQKRLPHWPPAAGKKKSRIIVANLDFTLRNTGETPGPEMMRQLNQYIKKFCRAIERRFGISRKEYGLAYCDELGGNNSNAHAHGIYVGPWLPQKRKELSKLWAEITGGSFIIWIKPARNFSAALYHAVKYPAKFAERSTPARLAELERIFHRVRRFHTLAAFYAPEVPEEEKPPVKRCPLCDSQLSEPANWRTLADLDRRGLRELSAVRAEVERSRALGGDSSPP